MNRMKKIVAVCLFMSLFYSAEAQKIRLKVTGQKDTTVYHIKYYGQKLFYADTAEMKMERLFLKVKNKYLELWGCYCLVKSILNSFIITKMLLWKPLRQIL